MFFCREALDTFEDGLIGGLLFHDGLPPLLTRANPRPNLVGVYAGLT